MKIIKLSAAVFTLLILSAAFLNACRPIKNMTHPPKAWEEGTMYPVAMPASTPGKKNVFIIADSKMTVLFDMLAPFSLFNATEQANVYIIAKDKTPILIKRDLFVCPQLTFSEADAMHLQADVMVIPALSHRDENQDSSIVAWIKNHVTAGTRVLAVCDGASTAAATGLYDGKLLTCHASDFNGLKAHFSKPVWVQNTAVTRDGHLYSTAGVSNAVEGSLVVIEDVFSKEIMQKVLTQIDYPAAIVKTSHNSIAVSGGNKLTVLRKVFFSKNRHIGLLLQDGMDEFAFASVVETYGRSFPAAFTAFNAAGTITRSRYGLTFISTVTAGNDPLDELHVLMPGINPDTVAALSKKTVLVPYGGSGQQYLIDRCLQRIATQYGQRFGHVVKISLDYN